MRRLASLLTRPVEPFVLLESGIEIVPRISPRARRVTLKVDPAEGCVELVMPPRASLRSARSFAERHEGWIRQRLASLPPRVSFADGAIIPLRDKPTTIRHLPAMRGTAWLEDGQLCVAGAEPHLARRVRDFLIAEARQTLGERVRHLALRIDARVGRISIRDQRTRWGSCSPDGRMTFSWRLVLAPPGVLDYVVAHEVAHLVHLHHGPRFWRLVERLMPEMRHWRGWLRRNGGRLLRYG